MTYLVVLVIGTLILIDGDLIVPAFKNHIMEIVWGDPKKIIDNHIRVYENELMALLLYRSHKKEADLIRDVLHGTGIKYYRNTGTYRIPS